MPFLVPSPHAPARTPAAAVLHLPTFWFLPRASYTTANMRSFTAVHLPPAPACVPAFAVLLLWFSATALPPVFCFVGSALLPRCTLMDTPPLLPAPAPVTWFLPPLLLHTPPVLPRAYRFGSARAYTARMPLRTAHRLPAGSRAVACNATRRRHRSLLLRVRFVAAAFLPAHAPHATPPPACRLRRCAVPTCPDHSTCHLPNAAMHLTTYYHACLVLPVLYLQRAPYALTSHHPLRTACCAVH